MRIDGVYKLIAAAMKSRPNSLWLQPRDNRVSSGIAKVSPRLPEQGAPVGQGSPGVRDSVPVLNDGWHELAINEIQQSHAAPEGKFVLLAQGRLTVQEVAQRSRMWEADYGSSNRPDYHPDNLFYEGMKVDGSLLYSPVDYVARAFSPSDEDARLAVHVQPQAKPVQPFVVTLPDVAETPVSQASLPLLTVTGSIVLLLLLFTYVLLVIV